MGLASNLSCRLRVSSVGSHDIEVHDNVTKFKFFTRSTFFWLEHMAQDCWQSDVDTFTAKHGPVLDAASSSLPLLPSNKRHHSSGDEFKLRSIGQSGPDERA